MRPDPIRDAGPGRQEVMTRSIAATETMDWHSNFRCTSSDPDEDIVIFDVEAQSVALQWSLAGRVAVPLARVLATGKEAGWYEVREQLGNTTPCTPCAHCTHTQRAAVHEHARTDARVLRARARAP